MRKALFGILMGATAAMPAVAQAQDSDGRAQRRAEARAERVQEHYRQAGERNEARTERRQEAQTERVERQEVRQEAAPRQYQRRERTEAVVQQQQQQQQQQSMAGRRGDGQRSERWGSGGSQDDARREAYQRQLEASRGASRQGVAESIGGNYARQGQRNQERYERQLREEYGVAQRGNRRDGDWNRNGRDGRNDRWSDRRDSRRSDWNRNWRSDNRFNWQRYRYSNRNLFRAGGYYSPYRGYGYNRLSIGFILDSLFYSNRYWLSDPWQYRLPPAPYGTQWVRYYDDVLLVDVYTGEVVDVIYDFFW